MAKEFNIKVEGLEEIVKTLQKAGPRATEATAILLKNFADTLIVTPAKQKYVPVAMGHLKASIRAEGPTFSGSNVQVAVVAGGPAAPYALKVHENPRAGRTEGVSPSGKPYPRTKGGKPTWSTVGQWKYLETPALEAARNTAWLKKEARAILRGMAGK